MHDSTYYTLGKKVESDLDAKIKVTTELNTKYGKILLDWVEAVKLGVLNANKNLVTDTFSAQINMYSALLGFVRTLEELDNLTGLRKRTTKFNEDFTAEFNELFDILESIQLTIEKDTLTLDALKLEVEKLNNI